MHFPHCLMLVTVEKLQSMAYKVSFSLVLRLKIVFRINNKENTVT